MGVDGPADRPPPPPPPDPPKQRHEAAEIVDEGGGAPADIVERHPADQPDRSRSVDAARSPADSADDQILVVDEGGGAPPDLVESRSAPMEIEAPAARVTDAGAGDGNSDPTDAPLTRDEQLERWKQAEAKSFSSRLENATPDQVVEMRAAAQKEFDYNLDQMQATALKNDSESDAAWRDAFDRNQIAQMQLDMIVGEPKLDSVRDRTPDVSEPISEPEKTDTSPFQRAGADLATRFTESDWRAADQDARKNYAEQADGAIREAYGLDERSPEWADLGTSYGRFDPRTENISYSDQVAEQDDPAEAIKTAAHENRHALQWEVVNDRAPEPEAGIRDEWRQAWQDYPTNPDPDSWTQDEFDQYWNNPLEVDAREAETAVYTAYLEQRRKGVNLKRDE